MPHPHFQYSGMMVPYVDGPKMDWTIDDALHSRFIRWQVSVNTSLTVDLLSFKSAKCKKVIQWSGDSGLDMYISWALPTTEVTLQTIWSRFEDFCKPQSNAVCTWLDLSTTSLLGTFSGFYMRDNEFIAKTINEGNTDLAQYPAAKVWQVAKKLESSKVPAKHIKQHTSSMKVLPKSMSYGTIILAYHPKGKKAVRNQTPIKALNHSNPSSRNSQTNTNLMIEIQTTVPDVVIPCMCKDLTAQLRSTTANSAQKSDTSKRCALPQMHTHNHSTIIKVSQNRHIKLLYLNILLSSTRTHATVIMMMILW